MTIFHDRLRVLYEDARDKDHKIGRKKFAEKCDVSKSLIDNYLSGIGWPTFDNFYKICKNLEVNPAWMIGQSDIKYNFELKFDDLAQELSKEQMEKVEEYVRFLKYEAKHRKAKNLPENINLPK